MKARKRNEINGHKFNVLINTKIKKEKPCIQKYRRGKNGEIYKISTQKSEKRGRDSGSTLRRGIKGAYEEKIIEGL